MIKKATLAEAYREACIHSNNVTNKSRARHELPYEVVMQIFNHTLELQQDHVKTPDKF